MLRSFSSLAAVISFAAIAAGCGFEHTTTPIAPTPATVASATGSSPNPTATPSLVGTWTSTAAPALPSPSTCGNFQYHITSQTSSSVSGTFSGICGAGLVISGNATGQLNGSAVVITVGGSATMPGLPNCSFSLTGTGTLQDGGNTLVIPYAGTTCLGPVTGTEVLHRPQPAADPPPPPPPPPVDPPPPPSDPTFGCSTADKPKLVECIHDHVNPPPTVAGAFDVTKRVAWALRGEGAGLLIKNGGENIISWQGYSFAAARICYPDGHIFKVLTDVPTTNGPSWQDNGFVDPALYVPAIDPNRP